MVNVGGLVSVGGTGGSGGGGGTTSGIQQINGESGPAITLVGTSGVVISPVSENTINIGLKQSGVLGVNGIDVQQVAGNFIIDAASISGAVVNRFATSFSSVSSGLFTHNLNSLDVVVQVRDADTGGANILMPDSIVIENLNQVSVVFNTPQTGRIVVI